MYKRRRRALPTLPSNPEASDAAVSASCFATVEDLTFYTGEAYAMHMLLLNIHMLILNHFRD